MSFRKNSTYNRHGMAGTPTYKSWQAARDRCQNPANQVYERYGGRGIAMCDSWVESFQNFFDDMRAVETDVHRLADLGAFAIGGVDQLTFDDEVSIIILSIGFKSDYFNPCPRVHFYGRVAYYAKLRTGTLERVAEVIQRHVQQSLLRLRGSARS